MSGLAAVLLADPATADGFAITGYTAALSEALAGRGENVAVRHLGAFSLLTRSAIPVIHLRGTVAAAVDGLADTAALFDRYEAMGSPGLIDGAQPYALLLGDGRRGLLALARNEDGPTLYYAEHRIAGRPVVFVGSEPAALMAAGYPAVPHAAVIDRFVASGRCDDGADTFFAGVRRVRAGEVVELARDGTGGFAIRTHQVRPPGGTGTAPVAAALGWSSRGDDGRVGVRLGPGLSGAALVGAARADPDRPGPLVVYSSTFPGLPVAAADYASTILGPTPADSVTHRRIPCRVEDLDLDTFLRDVGEPVPDLAAYLTWATARATAGEVDVLLDPGGGPRSPHCVRLADRIAARFGVTVRFPFRQVDPARAGELREIAARTLSPAAVAAAEAGPPVEPSMRELLDRLRGKLVTTLRTEPGRPAAATAQRQLSALLAGRRVDADQLFRQFLVARWLRVVVSPPRAAARPEPVEEDPVRIGAGDWVRLPVSTDVLAAGDRVAEKLPWYVGEAIRAARAEHGVRHGFHRTWFLVVAAKPVAVAQGAARAMWDIRPGRPARWAARLGGTASGFGTPWLAQAVRDRVGVARLLAGAAAARLGRAGWYDRVLGAAGWGLRAPREGAIGAADTCVVPPPDDPETTATELAAVVRGSVEPVLRHTFGGCAVLSRDLAGAPRVIGWSGADPAIRTDPPHLIRTLCADDPFTGPGPVPAVVLVRLRSTRPTRAQVSVG